MHLGVPCSRNHVAPGRSRITSRCSTSPARYQSNAHRRQRRVTRWTKLALDRFALVAADQDVRFGPSSESSTVGRSACSRSPFVRTSRRSTSATSAWRLNSSRVEGHWQMHDWQVGFSSGQVRHVSSSVLVPFDDPLAVRRLSIFEHLRSAIVLRTVPGGRTVNHLARHRMSGTFYKLIGGGDSSGRGLPRGSSAQPSRRFISTAATARRKATSRGRRSSPARGEGVGPREDVGDLVPRGGRPGHGHDSALPVMR